MTTSFSRRMTSLAASPNAIWWLIILAAAEASVFPIPIDLLLIPMLLARRDRAWFLAGICTAASVTGGIIGWCLGAFLMKQVGLPIAHFYHADGRILALEETFRRYGVWIILAKGFTPLPYKFVTLAAGASHYPLAPFVAASILTRGARFYLEAALLRAFGQPIQAFIEKRLTFVLLALLVLILGGVALIKFI